MTTEELDLMLRFAAAIAPAKFLPPHLRNDSASVLYALATAQDLGISWTHGMRSTFPSSEGGMGTKGDIMLSLLLRHGFDVQFEFSTEPIGCTCSITRPGATEPVKRTFTMEDAARIETRWIPTEENGRWEKLAENFFYKNYPKESCQWRSLAHCGRVAAADICGGMHLPEEMGPAPTQRTVAPTEAAPPAADEFVVGEKPEPSDSAKPSDNISPESKPEQASEPGPETQPAENAGDTAATEAPAAAAPTTASAVSQETAVESSQPTEDKAPERARESTEPQPPMYEVYAWTAGGWALTPDKPQTLQVSAELGAQARATSTGLEHCVVEVRGDQRKEVCRVQALKSATVAPKPVPPGPKAEAPTERPATFEEYIANLCNQIGGDTKSASKMIATFIAAYLGVAKCPKDQAKMLPVVIALYDGLRTGAVQVGDLRADPVAAGNLLAGRVLSPLDARFDQLNWPAEIRTLARQIMTAANQDEQQFLAWMGHPMVGDVSIASMDAEGLAVFFPLFLLARGHAWSVIDWAIANNKPITKTLHALVSAAERPISEWTPQFAKEVIDTMEKVTQPQPASQEDVAPEGGAGWDADGLPFD